MYFKRAEEEEQKDEEGRPLPGAEQTAQDGSLDKVLEKRGLGEGEGKPGKKVVPFCLPSCSKDRFLFIIKEHVLA